MSTQDEACSSPLPIDLGDMKAIQTLLVRKRKWKAKVKPEEVSKAANQRKTCNVEEDGHRSVQVCKASLQICRCILSIGFKS